MKTAHIFRKIIQYINLETELDDFGHVHEEIVKGSIFKGTNLWILVFAIIVASVGLNMNSTAVIIGAMLISPLMGPINGMGYGIATYNFSLFRQSLKNFSFAVLASLLASTTYFTLTPISTAHSELLARTSPTIYDVLIAFFGGLAGIVAISSKQKGNVIPGVAIATALMPPLCTAGYGLATFRFEFFLGALYLFTINTVFIALASTLVSQFLKFPITTTVDASQRKKINKWISAVSAIVMLPSIYFGYGLVQKEKFNENAGRYVTDVSAIESNYLLKSDIDPEKKAITLVYGGMNLTESQKEYIVQKAGNFNLGDVRVEVKQGLAFHDYDDKNAEVLKLRDELNKLNIVLKEREQKIDSLNRKEYTGQIILNEISQIFPQIKGCTYAETLEFRDVREPERTSLVIFTTGRKKVASAEKEKITRWVEARLNVQKVKVIFE